MEGQHHAEAPPHIGLIGGTFDPIHYGHLAIAEEVRVALGLTNMVFIPAGQPPHKEGRSYIAVEHRVEMVRLAIESNPHFSMSLIEVERQGPSYLVDTLQLLHQQWGQEVRLSFVIGWDSLRDFPGWYDAAGIVQQLAHLVAVHRPGYEPQQVLQEVERGVVAGLAQRLLVIPGPHLEISSTDLRLRIAQGRPIKYQVPETVERYIYEHGLYHATAYYEQ